MKRQNCILVVDDDPKILEVLQTRLEAHGFQVATAPDGERALDRMASQPVQLVITDLKMPGMSGLELLEKIRSRNPAPPVILLTAHGSISDAVRGMKLGAADFIEKPYSGAELVGVVRRMLKGFDASASRPPMVRGPMEMEEITGVAPSMRRIRDLVDRVAPTPSNVLITGESGTGKELVASTMHRKSRRASMPFVVIDCGALPDALLESELFGHRRGSFTSATQDKKGLLEEADGGTIFLDEIGNVSPSMQTRLLRFLQNGEVRRIGEVTPRQVDVRVISATNRDLVRGTSDGTFREDLYYRLKVVTIHLPPLRERLEDIRELTQRFLHLAAVKLDLPVQRISDRALAVLQQYRWPGNVRELKHAVEAAMALSRNKTLEPADFSQFLQVDPHQESEEETLTTLEKGERDQIVRALKDHDWVQKRAADALGISGRVIHYKIRKFNIQIPRT
ncbi:MAG: sigma-54-dependent transcriptional regulator [Acidobacteriota bacterium]